MAVPLVSFVVPAFNTGRFVRASIESALLQTYGDIEVVVVDDGSDDDTWPILQEVAAGDDRVRLERQDHRGFLSALERGREVARGELVARHDSDDLALADRIEKQVAFLAANPDVVAVGGAIDLIDEGGRVFFRGEYPLDHETIVRRMEVTTPIADPSTVIRRSALDAVGGWRPTFTVAGDKDLWLRLGEIGRLANLPDTLMQYRIHRGQVSGRRMQETAHEALAAYAAHRARVAGHPDPLDGVTVFDDELLRRLGIDHDRVADFTVDSVLWWAKIHERAGNGDAAKELWRRARTLAAGDARRLGSVIAAERRIRGEQGRGWQARLLRAEQLLRTRGR